MKKLFSILLFFTSTCLIGQSVTVAELDDCRKKAVENYPLQKQFDLNRSKSEINTEIIISGYLPQLSLEAQASYQSDVTEIPISSPLFSITPPPKDHYDVNLKVSQLIYDAGVTSKQKNSERLQLEIENKQLEIDLYQIKERVNDLFFSIVLLRKNKDLLELTKTDIEQKMQSLKSAVKYGAVLSKDVDVLQAELLKLNQRTSEIDVSLHSLYAILSLLTGDEYSDKTTFQLPVFQSNLQAETNKRLENQLFSLNREMIGLSKDLISSKGIPVVAGFGQAGYGKPGLNMLSDKFDDYYIIGAKLRWNIWNWNRFKKEKQILDLKSQIIDSRQESFNKILNMELLQKQSEIYKYQKLIKDDEEIIRLRSNIAGIASSQFDNGVITSTEYLSELNAETQAKLNLEIHRISLIKARVEYAHAKGEL